MPASTSVYWQGPSIGLDVGANGDRVMMLIYNLPAIDSLYRRYVGVNGSAYIVAGLGMTVLSRGGVYVVPIVSGVGARLGVNFGYLKFTEPSDMEPVLSGAALRPDDGPVTDFIGRGGGFRFKIGVTRLPWREGRGQVSGVCGGWSRGPLIQAIMYFALGLLTAGLLALAVAPAMWRRADRLARTRIESELPMSLSEIQAEKDQLRAGFAVSARRLEMKVEQLEAGANGQLLEISRSRTEIARLEADRTAKAETIEALESRGAELVNDLEAAEARIAEAKAELVARDERLAEQKAAIAAIEAELASAQVLTEEQKMELVARETTIGNLNNSLADIEGRRGPDRACPRRAGRESRRGTGQPRRRTAARGRARGADHGIRGRARRPACDARAPQRRGQDAAGRAGGGAGAPRKHRGRDRPARGRADRPAARTDPPLRGSRQASRRKCSESAAESPA